MVGKAGTDVAGRPAEGIAGGCGGLAAFPVGPRPLGAIGVGCGPGAFAGPAGWAVVGPAGPEPRVTAKFSKIYSQQRSSSFLLKICIRG